MVTQFHLDNNAKEIKSINDFQQQTLESQKRYFSAEQLGRIAIGQDCHIDDPELLSSKKHLQGKFSPLQAINAIKGKNPDFGIDIKQSENKNPEDQKTMVFNCFVKLADSKTTGYAEEQSKKLA